MEMILAILLYLHVIVSPGTYYKSQIDFYNQENTVRINQVQSSPAEMEIVEREYLPRVQQIVVIAENEME